MRNSKPLPSKKAPAKRWVYQEIQEKIKDYILEHSLTPGNILPTETELANQLGYSRNSVREAVKSLEALGILEARRGAGLILRPFTFDRIFDNLEFGMMFGMKSVIDVIEFRLYLEFGMAEVIAHDVTADQLNNLAGILKKMHKSAQKGIWRLEEEDHAFHLALWDNLENELMLKILDIFWKTYHHVQLNKTLPAMPDPMNNYSRHENIVRALEKQDVRGLKKSILRHYIGASYLSQVEDINNIHMKTIRYWIGLTLYSEGLVNKDKTASDAPQ